MCHTYLISTAHDAKTYSKPENNYYMGAGLIHASIATHTEERGA